MDRQAGAVADTSTDQAVTDEKKDIMAEDKGDVSTEKSHENNFYLWMMSRLTYEYVSVHAAQVAFFMLVSLFPLLMILITVARYTPLDKDAILVIVDRTIPGVLSNLIEGWINEIYRASGGVVFSLSIIGLLWSGSKGFDGITIGLDRIYESDKIRNYFVRRALSLIYLLAFIAMIILSLVLIVFGNKIIKEISDLIPFIGEHRGIILLLRIAVSFLAFTMVFALIFRAVPATKEVRGVKRTFRKELSGAGVTAILWSGFSFLYSYYVNYYGTINSIYGSLTSLVLLMLWMYFCITFVFVGALVNNFRYQTGRDPLKSAILDIKPLFEFYLSLVRS